MDIYPIGVIIESRLDGSIIYSSHKGVLNLDNAQELKEAQAEDEAFLKGNQE
jgi:hypothetical protein